MCFVLRVDRNNNLQSELHHYEERDAVQNAAWLNDRNMARCDMEEGGMSSQEIRIWGGGTIEH